MRALSIAAVALIAVVASPQADPTPLRGVPVLGDTGLRLLVSDNRPFVLDVDSGSVTRVAGIPAQKRGVLSVLSVGGRVAIVKNESWPEGKLWAVSGRAANVSYLGTGQNVTPAGGGSAVWIKTFRRARCALRRVGLNGRPLGAARSFPCASTIYPGGSLGLVVNRTRVLDPRTGRTVLRVRWGVLAAAGSSLVLAGPGRQFTVLNAATGAERRLRWPSILGGVDQPAVDPGGRFVALAFADPAYQGRGQQAMDVWLLDTKTANLTKLPDMPALVSLKRTSMAWSRDGRLVILAESAGKDVVAIWKPGRQRLAVRTVQLPDRAGGSDTFAPLQR
jgi:hypothetical protein